MNAPVSVLLMLAGAAGAALADGPHISYGPAGSMPPQGPRQEYCQYGFQDDGPGWGYTLGLGYQLGMTCEDAPCVDAVGFYVEFLNTPGVVDIVIFDDGVEVYRQAVEPDAGTNDFYLDTAVNINGTACVLLCPRGDYWSVLGEDFSHPPSGASFQSLDCTCEAPPLDCDLTLWAHTYCGIVPVERETWGSLRALYR